MIRINLLLVALTINNLLSAETTTKPGKLDPKRLKAFTTQQENKAPAKTTPTPNKLVLSKQQKDLILEYYKAVEQTTKEIKNYFATIKASLEQDPELVRLAVESMQDDLKQAEADYAAASRLNKYNQTKRNQPSHPKIPAMKNLITQMKQTIQKIDKEYQKAIK